MKKLFVLLIFLFGLSLFSYTVRIGDTLTIEVLNQPQLSRTVKVAFDGTIPYPYAGNIMVAGKTVEEIAQILKPYAEKVVKDPQITVYVVKYAPMLVFIQGAVNKVFDISVYPGITLTKLFSFVGISKDSNVDFENVQIKRGDNIISVNLLPYFYQGKFDEDIVLKEGDIIYIPPLLDSKTIKVMGAYTLEIPYEPGIKLSNVLLKLGPLDEKYADIKNAKVFIDGKVIEINLKEVISNKKDIELSAGSRIYIPKIPKFYVYIQGYVKNKGEIEFLPDEKKTLKTLLAKAGLLDEEVENEGMVVINNETKLKVKDVIFGEQDYNLNKGDIVQVLYEPFTVNVVGLNGGSVTLLHNEPRTLPYLIKKIGISQPESIESVQIVRNGKIQEFNINSLIYENPSIPLEKYDTVVIRTSQENAVYLTGDVASYVSFSLNEKITLQRILAKVGLSDYRKIESVTLNGEKLDFNKDMEIEKGSILNVTLKKPIYVTAMGYIKNTGTVEFSYDETADLKTLFGKLGGLIIGPDLYYTSDKVYIIRNGQIVNSLDAQKVYEGKENAKLENNDFVFVTEKGPNYVYVFGKGMPNTVVKFTNSEPFDFKTLISKIGGIQEGISKTVTILNGSTKTTFTWDEHSNIKLENGSTIIFDVDTENYVFVVDENGKANMFYLDKENTTLYEIISKAEIDKGYKFVKLTRDATEKIIDISNIEYTLSFNVKPGDIIKVIDAPQNIAYVLGEVNNPGIISVNEGTTVLEAIISAGYFSAKAAPSSVYLYKGGIDGKAIKVNLSGAIKGGNIEENPRVEPGDIVYVPADAFKTALDWVPIINNLITLYNNIYQIGK
ncbi:polysaccharide biosynthesis/export family protein [Thermosipho globiformans]|uniref:polysaccharide biosynthesis/export family protein n=1 Tax=Thermosipho globiformans TaxID=380685 RepID=UPI000F8E53A5|nr:polysaccharide biosynthesis/export family protein [Thermosipho globiformans]